MRADRKVWNIDRVASAMTSDMFPEYLVPSP